MERNIKSKWVVDPVYLDEAERLKALFEKLPKKISQMKFGELYEIGTQGAVWQYLNGRSPLNLKVALKFAAGLGCKVADFSPRLAKELFNNEHVRGSANQPVQSNVRIDFVPIYFYKSTDCALFLKREWVSSSKLQSDKLVAINVIGDSMAPSLFANDTVVVNTDDTTPKEGEVFAVSIYNDPVVMKRFQRKAGGWLLYSDWPMQVQYPPKELDDNVRVIGRVVFRQTERI